MKVAGLTVHHATDDAKAEHAWPKKLPELTSIVFGAAKKACGITTAQHRAYHGQYDRKTGTRRHFWRASAEARLLGPFRPLSCPFPPFYTW